VPIGESAPDGLPTSAHIEPQPACEEHDEPIVIKLSSPDETQWVHTGEDKMTPKTIDFGMKIDFGILAGAGAPIRDFKAGEVIFNEGDAAQEMFVIQRGEVEIRLGNRVLETVLANNIFGEMALIDAAPRSATAVATGDVTVVPVGEKQFLFMVSQTPHFALSVMRVLARRLRAMNSTM
jgi:CRP/FNR family transcriptional regulator, cyclic AMP receptor protein